MCVGCIDNPLRERRIVANEIVAKGRTRAYGTFRWGVSSDTAMPVSMAR
jgi:hypothetical protein